MLELFSSYIFILKEYFKALNPYSCNFSLTNTFIILIPPAICTKISAYYINKIFFSKYKTSIFIFFLIAFLLQSGPLGLIPSLLEQYSLHGIILSRLRYLIPISTIFFLLLFFILKRCSLQFTKFILLAIFLFVSFKCFLTIRTFVKCFSKLPQKTLYEFSLQKKFQPNIYYILVKKSFDTLLPKQIKIKSHKNKSKKFVQNILLKTEKLKKKGYKLFYVESPLPFPQFISFFNHNYTIRKVDSLIINFYSRTLFYYILEQINNNIYLSPRSQIAKISNISAQEDGPFFVLCFIDMSQSTKKNEKELMSTLQKTIKNILRQPDPNPDIIIESI